MVGFDQHNPHHVYDVYEHTLHALEATPPEPVLRMAVLFHDSGKPASFTLDEKGVGHFLRPRKNQRPAGPGRAGTAEIRA